MQVITLQKFLFNKRVELYEQVVTLKDKILTGNFTDKDEQELNSAENQLNLVKSIIQLCANRGRF